MPLRIVECGFRIDKLFHSAIGNQQSTIESSFSLSFSRANCKWVYQELDSRFRGNDVALQRFAVMPVQAGIQDLLLLRVNATEIRSSGAAGSAAHAQASGLCH